MTEVDYSSKQDEEQSWEADYARKPNLPKCWDMLTEPDGKTLWKFCIYNFGMKHLTENKNHKFNKKIIFAYLSLLSYNIFCKD